MRLPSLRELREAFRCLGIEPTADLDRIKKAWREAAKATHPDRFESEAARKEAHDRFVRIGEARDLIMALIESGRLHDVLNSYGEDEGPVADESRSAHDAADGRARERASSWPRESVGAPGASPHSAYEDEWTIFVTDEHAYFTIFSSTTSTVALIGISIVSGTVASVLSTILLAIIAALACLVVVLLFAAGSESYSLPFAGWIILLTFIAVFVKWIGDLWRALSRFFDRAALRILRHAVRTGFATRTFWTATACSTVAVALIDGQLGPFEEYARPVLLVLMSAIGTSTYLIYSRIEARLREIDRAFERIRAASAIAVVAMRRR